MRKEERKKVGVGEEEVDGGCFCRFGVAVVVVVVVVFASVREEKSDCEGMSF